MKQTSISVIEIFALLGSYTTSTDN